MKILFVMNKNFSHRSTSEHLLCAILERLAEQGHDILILQMLAPGAEAVIPESLRRYDVKTEAITITPQKKTNFIGRYLHAARNFRAYSKILKRQTDRKHVFIQSSNVAGVAVATIRRFIKDAVITCNVQDIMPYNLVCSGKLKKNSLVFRLLAAVQRYGYRHADRIITISEDMKDTLIADGTPEEKIEVVYNWSYRDEPYEGLDLKPVSHMFDSTCFNVVYAGNIGVMQNVELMIEAARLTREDNKLWFHIIGDGVYKDKLVDKAKACGVANISFWPMQPSELAPLIYSAADVNVIPLVKGGYRTALPSKTATCLACQKPIIFAIGRDSAFAQKAEREAGCTVVEADRPEELADAIRKIRSEGQNSDMAAFFKENCSITKNSRRYAEIITKGE